MALTIYAIRTNADFTNSGAYMMVGMLGLLMMIMLSVFFPTNSVWSSLIGGGGAMLFGFMIIMDTQKIFGSASQAYGGGQRQFEYSIDMYALAAWSLYLDYINFVLYLLMPL
ncbi:unnamed protein product, partial [Polarella glacialis]